MLQGSGSGSESGDHQQRRHVNVMSLVKTGSGTWNLSGANTYTGTTVVNGGLLTVSGTAGSIGQSTALTVSRGTLQLDDSDAGQQLQQQPVGQPADHLARRRLERQLRQRQRRHGDDRSGHGGDGREHAGLVGWQRQRLPQRRAAHPHGRRHAEFHRLAEQQQPHGLSAACRPARTSSTPAPSSTAPITPFTTRADTCGPWSLAPMLWDYATSVTRFPARALDHGRHFATLGHAADVEPQRRQHRLHAGHNARRSPSRPAASSRPAAARPRSAAERASAPRANMSSAPTPPATNSPSPRR